MNKTSNLPQNQPLQQTAVSGGAYFLCSKSVIEHFPNLVKSKPFKSGFDFEKEDEFYIIETNEFDVIEKYYMNVIKPFNEKSNISDIDFWLRECCDSQLELPKKGSITKCRRLGFFAAISQIWNLTNAKNQAYAIFKMSDYYGLNPIEFVNRVVR